jgi:hypothetical protein
MCFVTFEVLSKSYSRIFRHFQSLGNQCLDFCRNKQQDLAEFVIQTKFCAHDVASDTKTFQQLVTSMQFTEDVLHEHIHIQKS